MNKLLKLKTRDAGIVTQIAGTELLIYDLERHRAISLNQTAHQVFNSCDGTRTVEEIADILKMPEEMILLALDRLETYNLLKVDEPLAIFTPITRRESIRRIGLACVGAFPFVTGIVAPMAANAASCVYTNPPCNGSGTFCSLGAHTDCCSCNCRPLTASLGRCA